MREPFSRDEGLHMDDVRIIGGAVQHKEPEVKEPEAAGHARSCEAEQLSRAAGVIRELSQGRSLDAVIRKVRRDVQELGRVYSSFESPVASAAVVAAEAWGLAGQWWLRR